MRRAKSERKRTSMDEHGRARTDTYEEIPVGAIVPTDDNPRIIPEKPDRALLELRDSIAQVGVIQPVIVRRIQGTQGTAGTQGTKTGKDGHGQGGNERLYELRAGERRWRAAALAGLTTIPAIVRDLSDQEALEITLTENMQREDLHPLEEAKGIQAYLNHGWTADQVALKLGLTRKTILRKNQINNVSKKLRAEAAKGDSPLHFWGAEHWEIVARYPEHIQEKIVQHDGVIDYSVSPKTLRSNLEQWALDLFAAPWKHDDAQLCPKAGACTGCLKRSDAHPDLFDAVEFEDGNKKKNKSDGKTARCLDEDCYNEKLYAWMKLQVDEARAKYGKRLLIFQGQGGYSYNEEREIKKRLKVELASGHGDYERCREQDKGAVPCMELWGARACKVYWARKRASSSVEKKTAATDARVKVEVRRMKNLVNCARNEIDSIMERKDYGRYHRKTKLLAICATIWGRWDWWREVEELTDQNEEHLLNRSFEAALDCALGGLTGQINRNTDLKKERESLRVLDELLGLGLQDLEKEIEEEMPYPVKKSEGRRAKSEKGTKKTRKARTDTDDVDEMDDGMEEE